MTSKTIDFENADKDTPEDVIRGHSGMAWNICNVGEEGTCVIFGHGNRKHLKPLKDVELGETIKIKSQGIEYLYLIELIVSSKTINSWQYRLQQGSICWFQLVIRFITQDAHHKSMCYGERWNKGLIRSPGFSLYLTFWAVPRSAQSWSPHPCGYDRRSSEWLGSGK